MKKIPFVIILFSIILTSFGQEQAEEADTLRKDALKVYMVANDYIRREIPFINYVRDIKDAQVYIISTSQPTGAGGREYTYFLVGQHEFQGMTDTLTYASSLDDTNDQRRQGQVRTLKMGLMRYVLQTPLAKFMDIRFTETLEEEVSIDRWKNWVFRTQLYSYLNGERSYKYTSISGSLSASKVTSEWKLDFDIYYSYRERKYELSDGTYTYTNHSKSFNALIVKSLSEHWSVGGSSNIYSYDYSNYNLRFTIYPGIEYDIYPYSESTRKQFRILYGAGLRYMEYVDTTIYNKTRETLWGHSLDIAIEVVQKWGSIDMSLGWRNYFHDWANNNLSLWASLDLRIAKGLMISFGGGGAIIHDQINLVKGEASPEEILTQRKELETQYSYYTSMSLSYTFGSIYNNVVNPRFRGGGYY